MDLNSSELWSNGSECFGVQVRRDLNSSEFRFWSNGSEFFGVQVLV
jgi:hypothetical protein